MDGFIAVFLHFDSSWDVNLEYDAWLPRHMTETDARLRTGMAGRSIV